VNAGLGTQLRHLVELLDGAVGAAYEEAGLVYRPRYTPIIRALIDKEALTLGEIATRAGITQPAATQTVGLMAREGLLVVQAGARDGRQKVVRLSEPGKALLPALRVCWRATKAAADGLDAELKYPLSEALAQAIRALEAKPFGERIRNERERAAAAPDAPGASGGVNCGE
jgi:DNA-binding MarR family transcriptional regulator